MRPLGAPGYTEPAVAAAAVGAPGAPLGGGPAVGEPTVGELTASIFCREFMPVYEPTVDLATGALLGWRVHGRWIHPTRGVLATADYAAHAEDAGLLDPIDEIVVDRAFRRFRRASGGRYGASDPWVAISMPDSRLVSGGVLGWLCPLLARHGVPPTHVVLEFSAIAAMLHRPVLASTVEDWARLGGTVAVDPAALDGPEMNVPRGTTLVLDSGHVGALTDHGRGEAWAAGLVDRAARVGARVLAQGVETDEQLRVLTSLRCDAAQGVLVGGSDPELTQPSLPLVAA